MAEQTASPVWTDQSAFAAVWDHFIARGGALAVVWSDPDDFALSYTTCRYRTDDGARCAIGLLIPDREYGTEAEHSPLSVIRTAPEPLADTLAAEATLAAKIGADARTLTCSTELRDAIRHVFAAYWDFYKTSEPRRMALESKLEALLRG